MRKKLIALALIALLSASFAFAASFKADLAIGTQDAGMNLNFKSNGSESKLKSTIEANLSGAVDFIFDKDIGMNVIFGTDFKNEFKVGAGFLFMTSMNTNSVFSASAGPYFIFGGNESHMGIYVTADFDFILTKALFLRVGTGMDFEFLQFGGNDTTTNIDIDVPLPRLALGWKF